MQNLMRVVWKLFLLGTPLLSDAQGYEITVQVKNYPNALFFLGNYYGKQTYVQDSARSNAQGMVVFKGKAPLPGGIYFVVFPDKQRYFELVLDQQQRFSISVDTSDLIGKIRFKQSSDNELFYQYNRFLAAQSPQYNALNKTLKQASGHADSARVQEELKKLNEKIAHYRDEYIRQHPQTLLAKVFRTMKDPELPSVPKLPGGKTDSNFAYQYFKAHYWDHVDFADQRLLRTPVLEGKLNHYFTQVVVPHPDSASAAADEVIARARANKEVFHFVLWWLTYNYESSPYMGMDAVFVHLVEKYYVTGQAFWLSEEQKNKILSRAYSIAPNLIGQKAPDLHLVDSLMKPVSLYSTRAKFTVLVFWDPTCGHCKIEIPRLDSAYRASWYKKDVKIFGVRTDGTKEQWQDFINQHHLSGWIHAWDPEYKSNFHRLFDVYSTPTVYLLDANKKILAKRLNVEQLDQFMNKEWEKQ